MLLHACFAALFFAVSFADRTFPVDAQRCAVSLRRMYASLYIDQTNVEVLIQRTSRVGNNKNLSCCRETARPSVLFRKVITHKEIHKSCQMSLYKMYTLPLCISYQIKTFNFFFLTLTLKLNREPILDHKGGIHMFLFSG